MARHNNIILIVSLLALFLFIAHTNASRDEEQSCSKKLRNVNLKNCQKHLMKRLQKDEDEDEDVLKIRGINYIRNRREEDLKNECCNQLSEVKLDCRCQALQEIMDNLNDKLQKKEMDDAEREVRTLPMRCGIAPPLRCDLSSDD